MSTADWIVVGVGAAQALFLAIAALFAWRAYRLARSERHEAAEELRRSEDRRLLQSIVDEVMQLARDVQHGSTLRELAVIRGDLQRLRIALAFAPVYLHTTDLLSALPPDHTGEIADSLDAAREELAEAADALSRSGSDTEPA